MNLAFVIPHYGVERTEPLEIYCRESAENLYRRGIDVTIYTFTDGKKSGEYILNGVLIKRFPPEHRKIPNPLIEGILKEEKEFDAIVLFGAGMEGTLKLAENLKKKKILVPYLYENKEDKDYFSKIFSKFDALLFMTEKEKLVFEGECKRKEVIEFGVEIKTKIEPENFRKKHFILSDYILCFCGEEDLKEIIENFKILRRRFPFLSFIISGKFSRHFPFDPDIKYMELIDEKERLEGIKGSLFTLFPSKKDSPDYFFLESLSLSIPAVVNEKKETLVDLCLKSNGGLWYSGKEDFLEVASLLIKDRALKIQMGIKASKYIKENHSPEKIFQKWKTFIESII